MIKHKVYKDKLKNKVHNVTKKVLLITVLATNMLCYFPTASFAADDDSDERYPAIVPAAANEIISKYVSTGISSGSSASGTGVISNYEQSGDGWTSVTEVTANGKTRIYRNYKQGEGSYAGKPYYNGQTMAAAGCGPTSIAIALSGYRYDISPYDIAEKIGLTVETNPYILSEVLSKLNIDNKLQMGVQSGGTEKSTAINEIRQNLESGKPVLVGIKERTKYSPGQHWMTAIGINGDTITISNPCKENDTDDITNFVTNCLNSYILITEENDNGGSSSSSTSKKTSSSSIETGTYSIEKYPSSQYGYAAIFTSGTTGRQFKEYKQSIPGWDSKYNITRGKLFMGVRMWNS